MGRESEINGFDDLTLLSNKRASEIVRLSDYGNFSTPASIGNQASLWTAISRNWLPALALGTAVFVGMAIYTLTRTPIYRSELLVLADNKQPVSVAPASEGLKQNNNSTESDDVSVDIQILKSRPLVSKALNKLDGAFQGISVEQVMSNLSISSDKSGGILSIAYTDTIPERTKAVLEVLGPTYIVYSLESRRSQASSAIKFIESQLPQAKQDLNRSATAIAKFREQYGMVDPDTYAESVSARKQSLQQEVFQASSDLALTKRRYQELLRQMGQVGQDPETALVDSVLSQDETYRKLVNQLRELEAQYAVESTRFQESYPGLRDLKDRRDEVRNLVAQQAQRIIGNKVSQSALKTAASSDLQQGLANQLLEVQTDLATQVAKLNNLRQNEAEISAEFKQVPSLQQNYTELQRQYQLHSATVNNFLEKLQSLKVIEAQETAPWKILEVPYLPDTPISPSLQRGLLLGLVAGGLLGGAVAILLDRLDKRVREVEEIKALVDLPLLGAVPKANVKDLAASYGDSYLSRNFNSFTESIRSLALSLPYLRSTQGGKIFALTSSIPGEGKTTVTYNLGLGLAELGKRVLIVDADLHNPSIHVVSQLPNVVGLSTAIATDQPWQKLIHSSSLQSLRGDTNTQGVDTEISKVDASSNGHGNSILVTSLQPKQAQQMIIRRPDILTAGPSPLNPIAWLSSAKMTELLEEWSQAYDYVLIDTPPVVGVADAQTLAAKVDGVVLVVGVDHVTRPAVSRAMELLMGTGCSMPGVVVNLVERDRLGYGHPHSYGAYYGKHLQNDQEMG